MKKYKLIKEYPWSCGLGTIVEEQSNGNFKYINSPRNDSFYTENFLKLYPDHWEEVKENEYEILSFISTGRIKSIFYNFSTTERVWRSFFIASNVEIHSIKRLSDEEVFTIRDKVHDGLIIDNFYFNFNSNGNELLVRLDTGVDGHWTSSLLKELIKDKKSLFITEDGVDIFEGDKYYRVCDSNKEIFNNPTEYIASEAPYSVNHIHFLAKERAEEYILMNKPYLSYKDICDKFALSKNETILLKKLIKSKLNLK